MATPTTLLLIPLLLVVAHSPSALALVINGLEISSVNFGGMIYCTIDGNPSSTGPSTGLPGIPVNLRCGDANNSQLMGTAITDLTGKYLFSLRTADTISFDPAKCYIEVRLPLGHCVASLPNGLLRAPISVLNVVQILLGNLLVGIVGPLQHIA